MLCSHKNCRNYTFFLQNVFYFSQKGQSFCVFREINRWRETAILTHNLFLAALRGAQPLTGALCDWPNLFWPKAETNSRLTESHVAISIYHFTAPTISTQLRDCFCLFTQVCPVQRNLIDSSVKGQYATHEVKQFTMGQCTNYHNTTNHSFNCYDHVMYAPQTCTYQNIAKLLTHAIRILFADFKDFFYYKVLVVRLLHSSFFFFFFDTMSLRIEPFGVF